MDHSLIDILVIDLFDKGLLEQDRSVIDNHDSHHFHEY